MTDLDSPAELEEGDASGFLASIEGLADQLEQGWALGKAIGSLPYRESLTSIAVLGMGGSGISGNLLKAVLGPAFPRVVETLKGYELPGWVGPNTLVFAVSYSGETEEVLETFEMACSRGARIVTVSTGGTLSKLGESRGCPAAKLPPGLQPRAALGYLSMALLATCQKLGLGDFEGDVEETVTLLRERIGEYGRHSPTEGNPAKQLARRLDGLLPLIYGSEGLAEVAAYRWKCQLNECSKVAAYHHFFPELDHNEVVGWGGDGNPNCRAAAVVLRHPHEHHRIDRRISVTLPLIAKSISVVEEVWASGASTLASLMDLVCLGDFVASYLALVRGVDPGQVDVIDEVKRRLGAAEITARSQVR